MTAVRNQITLNTLARHADIAAFIHQHGDKLGHINTIQASEPVFPDSVSGHGQIDSDPNPAASLLAWLYLLDASKVTMTPHGTEAQVYVRGQLAGNEFWAYARFHAADAAYLVNLPAVTVHSLRRIQVGDVPEVVAA